MEYQAAGLNLSHQVEYSIRESQRAKHVNIRVLATGEVQVVIPVGFNRSRIPEILQRKQGWIERTLSRVQGQQRSPALNFGPPSDIDLVAIAKTWQITYQPTTAKGVTATEHRGRTIVIQGNTDQPDLCREVLRRWLTHQGHQHLVPWLRQVSQQYALPFSRAGVRGQKTLWASCSRDTSISLNYKLLFLPPHLVHYVFVHELCHTIHLNHSANFWALVESKLPDYQAIDAELNQAMSYVPGWVNKA